METRSQQRIVTRKPHFFKILLGDFSLRLRIPPPFTKHISKEASNKAILKGPGGGRWRVHTSKGSCNDTYFDAGWEAFAKDHRLHEHDFLVFRYDGSMHFYVRIFDKTGCEREDAFRINNSEEIAYKARGKRDGCKVVQKDFGCHSQKSKKRSRMQFESGQYNSPARKAEMKSKHECPQPTPIVEGKDYCSPDSFSSKFPFFKKCLTKTNVMLMHIPVTFHRYLPKKESKYIFQDPSNRNWEVFIGCYGKQTFFSQGFRIFCRVNNLKEGDTCIFELLDISAFRVHVYPKDMGQKKSKGERHWTDEIKKDAGCCHSQKFKICSIIQNESGQEKPSTRKVEVKTKQEFGEDSLSSKGKVCNCPDSFSSKFPFFRKCLSKMSVTMPCRIHVPKSFHGYLPGRKRNFILQDPNGNNWELSMRHSGDKISFSGGLGAFCIANNLKEGDTCIFELLDESTFRTHVYPRGLNEEG